VTEEGDEAAVEVVDVAVLVTRAVVESGRVVTVVVVETVVVLLLLVVQAVAVVELDVEAVDTSVTIMLADPWLGTWVASPMYCPLIAKVPAELGVRTIEQVPDGSRLQLESTLGPSDDGPLRRTNAVGMVDGVASSTTVTLQVAGEPSETIVGEQTMVVEVGSCTVRSTPPELAV
jgi:hypothetical protein